MHYSCSGFPKLVIYEHTDTLISIHACRATQAHIGCIQSYSQCLGLTTITGVTLQETDNYFLHRTSLYGNVFFVCLFFFLQGAGLLSLTKPEMFLIVLVN